VLTVVLMGCAHLLGKRAAAWPWPSRDVAVV